MKQQPLQLTLCTLAAALVLALSACGGGGSTDAAAAVDTPSATPNAFVGTAYLKTRNTVLYDGKTSGLARDTFQALVDQCNSFRSGYYGLAPVSPSEATLASIDVSIHEKFFDTNKALTLITGTGLELPDVQRWLKEFNVTAKTGAIPPVPINCAEVKVSDYKNGTLWRDGIRYDLRFNTSKAIGNKGATTRSCSYPRTNSPRSLSTCSPVRPAAWFPRRPARWWMAKRASGTPSLS